MSIFHKIGLSVFALSVAWGGGYWHGRQHGKEAAIKAAVAAYQLREKINHETDSLNPHALLLAGCNQSMTTSCAGWSKPPKINQPVRLVQVEPDLSRWIVATDKFRIKQRCWK